MMFCRMAWPSELWCPPAPKTATEFWRQHVPQAGHIGRPLPFGDRVMIRADGGVGLAGRQREREVVHAVGQDTAHRQPGVGEHLHHERVLDQGLRHKGVDPPAAGQRNHVLQQQRADAAIVHIVGDRHSDLGGPGAIADNLVAAAADNLTVQRSQQRGMVRRGLTAYSPCLPLGRNRAHPEETQIEIATGHLGMHVTHCIEIAGPCGPNLDRGAISQQSVGTGLGLSAHVTLPDPAVRRASRQPQLCVLNGTRLPVAGSH